MLGRRCAGCIGTVDSDLNSGNQDSIAHHSPHEAMPLTPE
jgi:hypothetical protein